MLTAPNGLATGYWEYRMGMTDRKIQPWLVSNLKFAELFDLSQAYEGLDQIKQYHRLNWIVTNSPNLLVSDLRRLPNDPVDVFGDSPKTPLGDFI
jgi:hypothetical protein